MIQKHLMMVWSVGVLVLLTSSARAGQKVGITVSGGVVSGGLGDANGFLEDSRSKLLTLARNHDWLVMGDFHPVRAGMDWSVELTWQVTSRFSLGLGSGFIGYRRSQEDIVMEYSLKSDTAVDNPFGRDSLADAKTIDSLSYSISAIPVTLSGYYRLPLSRKVGLSLGGGIGYYFCRWTQQNDSIMDLKDYYHLFGYHFDTRTGSVGGQASLSLEWELSKRVALFCGVLGRLLTAKDFNGKGWVHADPPYIGCGPVEGTLYFYQNQGFLNGLTVFKDPPDPEKYREAEVTLSGFSARVGIRVSL